MDNLTRKNTISLLNGLPPGEYLGYCDTSDQEQHWHDLRTGFGYLRQSFRAYFSGEAEPKIDVVDSVFWGKVRDWYLSYYTVIQSGWHEITAAFEERELNLNHYAKSPGEAFIRTIEDDCAAAFFICRQSHYSATPYEDRTWAQLQYKCIHEKDPKKKITLEKQIDAITRKRTAPIARYMEGRLIFLEICNAIKDETTQDRLRDYRRKQAELDRYVAKLNHPNQRRTGGTWVKGKYRPSG